MPPLTVPAPIDPAPIDLAPIDPAPIALDPIAQRPAARRDLRLFLVGQVTSVFGSALTSSAVSMVAVVELGASAAQVSTIVVAGTLPALFLGPVAGVLLDRVTRPRRMLVAADLVAACAVAACAVAALGGALTVAWLIGLAVVLRLVGLVVEGLYFSHLNALGVEDVGAARGKLQSSEMLARAVANSMAGPVVAVLGAALLFVADVVTYLLGTVCLLLLRAPDTRTPRVAPRAALRVEFAAGIAALRGNRLLTGFLVYVALGTLAMSGVAAQRAVFLLDDLALPVALYTLPAVVATVAGAAGALYAPRLLARGISARSVLLWGLPAGTLGSAALPLAGGGPAGILAAMAVSTAIPLLCGAAANIALVGVFDQEVGDEFFGRVSALLGAVATLAGTLGAVLGGVLGTAFGVRTGIWACVALEGVGALALIAILRRPAREVAS